MKDVNSDKIYTKQSIQVLNWRPSGKLVSTLYDHKSSVEKIIPMNLENHNFFLSFSNEGQMFLWDIQTQDYDFSTEKILEHNIPDIELKSITTLDNYSFAVANKNNTIEIYKLENNKSNFYVTNKYKINHDYGDITALLGSKNKENKTLIYCSQKGKLVVYDMRIRTPAMTYNLGVQRGIINAVDYSKDEKSLFFGTLGGYLLNYDFRLNHLVGSWKYNENTPIIGLNTYSPTRHVQYDNANLNPNSNYLLIWTGAQDHEIGLWNLNNFNCNMLFKVNSTTGKQIKPFMTEIPYIQKDLVLEETEKEYYEFISKRLNQYRSKAYHLDIINSELYSLPNKRYSKITNLFESPSTVQTAFSPIVTRYSDNNNENCPYILTAGNDQIIRYWDLSKDNMLKKSYCVNGPSNLNYVNYNSCSFGDTVILQSNEIINSGSTFKKESNVSEYHLYNGIYYHNNNTSSTNDNDDNLLKYRIKLAEASHKNVITDLQMIPVSNTNLLLSSSWDGTVKIWK